MKTLPITVRASVPFMLFAASAIAFDSSGAVFLAVFAVLIHEGAHFAAIMLMGGRVSGIELRLGGAEMRYFSPLSYKKDALASLAGPAGSLLAFAAALHFKSYYFAGVNLMLCLFNLAPAMPLDGGRALYSMLCEKIDPEKASVFVKKTTLAFSVFLVLTQSMLLMKGLFNPFLLFPMPVILRHAIEKSTLHKKLKKVKSDKTISYRRFYETGAFRSLERGPQARALHGRRDQRCDKG